MSPRIPKPDFTTSGRWRIGFADATSRAIQLVMLSMGFSGFKFLTYAEPRPQRLDQRDNNGATVRSGAEPQARPKLNLCTYECYWAAAEWFYCQ